MPALMQAMADVVRSSGTLYSWASRQPQSRLLRGRAPVYVVSFDDIDGRYVVRHAWHGGLLAPITRDVFLPPTRALREMRMSAQLRSAGIETAECVGFARYRAPGGLYRADVVTRYVPDAVDLGALLANGASEPDLDFRRGLDAAIETVLALSRAGFVHPDLNAKNLLITRDARGERLRAVVIDVDTIEHLPHGEERRTRAANAARLLRSLQKIDRAHADANAALFAPLEALTHG